jgi:hypothetical protein
MNDIEDRLRAAFEHQASTVTEESLRPAQPPSSPESTSPPRLGRGTGPLRWVVPSLAAAAVVAVTVGISIVHEQSTSPSPPSTTTSTQTVPGPTTTQQVDTGVPLPEKGRNYDVGSVIGSDTLGPAGSLEIYLHRWKLYGVSDAEVAKHGVKIAAHTDSSYASLSEQIYVAPVAKDATFVINKCATISSLDPQHVSSYQFLRYQNLTGVVFRFDSAGRIIDAETDGGC